MKFTGKTVEEAIQNGLNELNIPRKKAHITVLAREKKGFLGFGKKPAQVEIDVINETTVVKANQKAVRGVPSEINELNEPVKSVSEATIDLGRVVSAVKEFEKSGQVLDDNIKAKILKNDQEAKTILEETGRIEILRMRMSRQVVMVSQTWTSRWNQATILTKWLQQYLTMCRKSWTIWMWKPVLKLLTTVAPSTSR